MIFLYLFTFRSLSGLQNGFGYAKKDQCRLVISAILSFATLWCIFICRESILGVLLSIISILSIWLKDNSFSKRIKELKPNIHLYELLLTSGVTLALTFANYNLIDIACHVYPALILHKGFINLGGGHDFFYYGTNDDTGKTWNIIIFGKEFHIPREPKEVRYILALSSLIIIIISYRNNWFISLKDIIQWL